MRKADAVRKIMGELKVISEWLEAEGKSKSSESIDCGIMYLSQLAGIYETESNVECVKE